MKKVLVIGLSGMSYFLQVDHFHRNGETLHVEKISVEAGGKGYNQAVVLNKLGVVTTFITKIGYDNDGVMCCEQLNENIKSHFIKSNERTAFAYILVNKKAENQVTVYKGSDINKEDIINCQNEIIKAEVISLQGEMTKDAIFTAIEIAKNNNIFIVINPSPTINIDQAFLSDADIVIANEVEAKELLNVTNISEIKNKLLELPNKKWIITLGKNGVIWQEDGLIKQLKPPLVKALDTTGAGDTFTAAFIAKINNKLDNFEAAIIYAQEIASKCVKQIGVLNNKL